MKRTTLLLMAAVIANTICWSQSQSDLRNQLLQQYSGEWTNIDSITRSITKIVIKNSGELTVQAFGNCHPTDCDFGITELHLISDSVDNNSNVIPFDHGLAIWDKDYAQHFMKFMIQSGPFPELHVDVTVLFKDNSGRSNYNFSVILRKAN